MVSQVFLSRSCYVVKKAHKGLFSGTNSFLAYSFQACLSSQSSAPQVSKLPFGAMLTTTSLAFWLLSKDTQLQSVNQGLCPWVYNWSSPMWVSICSDLYVALTFTISSCLHKGAPLLLPVSLNKHDLQSFLGVTGSVITNRSDAQEGSPWHLALSLTIERKTAEQRK